MGLGELVPGRTCGSCTVCCIVPGIDTPDAQKKSNVRCRNCGDGCAVYERRPAACAQFYCAWRRLPKLGDEWRPDTSGVLATLDILDPPESKWAITLMPIADADRIAQADWFVSFVRANGIHNVPLFLALPGAPGHLPVRARINGKILEAAAWDSPGRVAALIADALSFLRGQPPRAHAFHHHGNDMTAYAVSDRQDRDGSPSAA